MIKHAHAASASVRVYRGDGALQVEIRDDGVGGADADSVASLAEMRDRVTALGGSLVVVSPPGRGTCVTASLPLPSSP